ncbi:MAG: histidine kinase, partial [Bacteroidia bacterium]
MFEGKPGDPIELEEALAPGLGELVNTPVYHFAKSKDDGLWISADPGLYKYYPDSTLQLIAARESMPFWSKAVMLEDSSGILWIGTQKGLIRFDGVNFTGIERRHGLLSSEINTLCYTNADELWLGTSRGVSIIEQASHAFYSMDRIVPRFELDGFSPGKEAHINLGDDLSFGLTSRDYLYADLAKTQYRLDGGDWTWFEKEKTIEDISSGEHQLYLRGKLPHTGWYELEPVLFQVRAWWENEFWQSIVLGLILLGGILWLSLRARLRKEKKYNLRLQKEIKDRIEAEGALSRIRQEVARDFHDELGNHLASITVLSSMAQRKIMEENEDVTDMLSSISANSKELHAITKDFLWSIEGKWHYLDELVVYLADRAIAFFEPLGIQFKCIPAEGKDTHVKLPLSIGRNILLIFKEAMTNVAKYAEASSVTLTCKLYNDFWEISLSNNGLATKLDEKPDGRGLRNM